MAEAPPIKVEIEVLHVWQLCPKCNGEGGHERVSVYQELPPFVKICDLCNGKKIISKINGKPPEQ